MGTTDGQANDRTNDRDDLENKGEGDPSLSQPFLQRLNQIVPAQQQPAVTRWFYEPKRTSFRVNTLRGTTDEIVDRLCQQSGLARDKIVNLDWCDHAFHVAAGDRSAVTHSQAASEGDIYVQGLSSVLCALMLAPQPGQWNLDMCAAPGGKATHLAQLMGNEGKLSVVEPIKKRMYRLADNLKRQSITIGKTYLMDGRKVGGKVPARFDCIMLDAPCSGESRMHVRDPESFAFWSPRKIREQSRKQKGLILSAFQALKPGGRLMYSTCSFAPEENEAIVQHLLDANEQAHLVSLSIPIQNTQPGLTSFQDLQFSNQMERACRILPNDRFDGFFMALICKAD